MEASPALRTLLMSSVIVELIKGRKSREQRKGEAVHTREQSFRIQLYNRLVIRTVKMKRRGCTYVYRESITTSPSRFSIGGKCFRGGTILRFPRGEPSARCCGLLTDLEETATAGSFLVTGHLRSSLSNRRRQQWHRDKLITVRTSRFVHVTRKLLHDY